MAPITRCCAKYVAKYDIKRPAWLWLRSPIMVPPCCAKYGANYKSKRSSWCNVWRHVRDSEIECREFRCQVWHQSSNGVTIMATMCCAKCDTELRVWCQLWWDGVSYGIPTTVPSVTPIEGQVWLPAWSQACAQASKCGALCGVQVMHQVCCQVMHQVWCQAMHQVWCQVMHQVWCQGTLRYMFAQDLHLCCVTWCTKYGAKGRAVMHSPKTCTCVVQRDAPSVVPMDAMWCVHPRLAFCFAKWCTKCGVNWRTNCGAKRRAETCLRVVPSVEQTDAPSVVLRDAPRPARVLNMCCANWCTKCGAKGHAVMHQVLHQVWYQAMHLVVHQGMLIMRRCVAIWCCEAYSVMPHDLWRVHLWGPPVFSGWTAETRGDLHHWRRLATELASLVLL
jgi:hypothetical protein